MNLGSYIVYTTIQRQTGSDDSETVLEEQIDFAEAELTAMLTEEGYDDDTSSKLLQAAAFWLSMKYLYNFWRLSGKKPANLNLGGFSMSDNIDQAMAFCEQKGQGLIKSYIRKQEGDAQQDSAIDMAQTVVRTDHRMKRMQVDDSIDVEYHDRADEYGTQETDP